MRKIFTIGAIGLAIGIFAQEAGKAGELLKNEARTSEMQTQKKEVLGSRTETEAFRRNEGIKNNNNRGFRDPNSNRDGFRNKNYQWNYNFGNSEVFLRIPERGYFTVEIADQMMSNAAGKYRFFDLNAGLTPIAIYENGFLIYRTRINIRNNSRMILDFFTDYGLYLLDTVPVRNQSYGFNDWNDVWNNPYENGNWNNGYGYGNVMDDRSFGQFLQAIGRNSFDDNKLDFLKQQIRNTMFTAEQAKRILQAFSFDSRRLDAGKILYNQCVDRQNYFIVYDTFSFESSKRQLMQYVQRQ